MKKTVLTLFCLSFTFILTSQNYSWQWATRGGGTTDSYNEDNDSYSFDSEQIKDIAVDASNNYYYLATLAFGNTEYEGSPLVSYNSPGGCDMLLISTDCAGNLRWKQTIGGGGQDYSYKIALDNNGGIYLGMNTLNISGPYPNTYLPPYFSAEDHLPVLEDNTGEQEGQKTTSLLKYNTTDGSLIWRKMLQGNVSLFTRSGSVSQIQIDSNGTIYLLTGFLKGTHLDGMAVVPDTYTDTFKYYIAKFDASGTVLGAIPIPLEGGYPEQNFKFLYDENLQRFYLAGQRFWGDNSSLVTLSYNGTPFQYLAFILAFGSNGTELWRKEMHTAIEPGWNEIQDMKLDTDSSIYLTGKYFNGSSPTSFGEYALPTVLSGNVMYVVKFDPSGAIAWLKTPTGYTNSTAESGNERPFALSVNNNEVALACQGTNTVWDNVSMTRPDGYLSDPVLVRFNKITGTPVAINEISGPPGYVDALTAVVTDNNGDYVVGGYFRNALFTNVGSPVSPIAKVQYTNSYTDFFIAKLATAPCIPLAIEDFSSGRLKLYPNPSSGQVYIKTGETLKNYRVFNLLGQSLLEGDFLNGQDHFSIESLESGTYLVSLLTVSGQIVSEKIIKL